MIESRRQGLYVASRVKHAAMWHGLRSRGLPINSTWIDESGDGETGDFGELWQRIETEVCRSAALVLYVNEDDFPLKGALIECGMALAAGVPVFVATTAKLEERSMRPLGSWILHPSVRRFGDLEDAIEAACAALIRVDPDPKVLAFLKRASAEVREMPWWMRHNLEAASKSTNAVPRPPVSVG